jgi:hypothetical protein
MMFNKIRIAIAKRICPIQVAVVEVNFAIPTPSIRRIS